ncbi:MAG: GumC family protein [Blastocatellia bacterium]
MLDANKLTPAPLNGDEHNKLVESLSPAQSIDLRREGYPQGYGAQSNDARVHLRDYWRIVRRRLWVPISIVLIVVTLTTIFMLRSPSIYEGSTTIQIDREDTASLNVSKEFNIVGPEDSQYINTQLKNLQSPTMAYKVVKVLDLEHNPKFLSAKTNVPKTDTLVTSGSDDQQADRERLSSYTGTLLGNVEISRLRETRLIQIKYKHNDPEMAKKVSDAWAEVFRDDSLATRKQGNRDTASFLEEQISRAKLDLMQSEEKLMNYRRGNQVIDFGDSKQNTVIDRLSELNTQLLTAENERKSLQVFYELSRTVTDLGTLPEIQSDTQVQDINRKLTELKERKAKLDVEYTPEWPEVKQVAQQIEQLENERRAAYKRIQTSLENRYHTAAEREKFLRTAFNAQKGDRRTTTPGRQRPHVATGR